MSDVNIPMDVLERGGGYHGRIVHVDLGSGQIWYDEHDPAWYRRYGGGGALAGWYMLREIPIGADPLGPENLLIFASSIVGGVNAPGLSKHTVLAKSPLSDGVAESQSASTFSRALKQSGLDAIIVHGAADRPCYLVIRHGKIEIRDAESLWGLETADAHDRLRLAEGTDAHTAIIGPAGENLIRYASIVNDVHFMNCRTGVGAVMGSKRLKALVAIPSSDASFGDPEVAQEAIDWYWAHRRESMFNQQQEDEGILHWLAGSGENELVDAGAVMDEALAGLPMACRNWRRSVYPHIDKVSSAVLEAQYRVSGEGPPDYLEFFRRYAVPSGEFATDPRYGGVETESILGVAAFPELDDIEGALKAVEMTYRFGLDAESLGGTIAWVMDCVEQGILDADDLGGRDVRFGDARAFLELTETIVYRRGLGDLLAEGSARAAIQIGRGSERLAMTCRGIELSGQDPRSKPGWALAAAAGPVGPDFIAVEHDWDMSPTVAGSGAEQGIAWSRAFGLLERLSEADFGPRKVRQTVLLQRWWSGALESLLFDYRSIAPMRAMSPTRVEQLVRGITGWDFSLVDLMAIGERRLALLQEFNRRHGLTRADDRFPLSLHEQPISEGPYEGFALPLGPWEDALDLYYAMSGWDAAGWPTEAKLHELDLGWVIEGRSDVDLS